ncbi:flagellar hook-basal body complex protein FliE [Flaviflagellibacter deserti]|uniref:Flagellar hook-basal body complex protein FliE n=1 Tax=Flaviflagellibacter deserti TaxID=2267266 RepID=A0ABV9Z759_9HYPH
MATPSLAASAYSRLANIGGASSGLPTPGIGSQTSQGGGFAQMLESAIGEVSKAGANSDAQTMQAVQGKGDIVNVVTAVAESEVALQTLVSVRDKVISAYEEIMRMPI